MAGPEAKIERAVVAKMRAIGVKVIKLDTSSETGWPDRIVLIPGGRPLFIEFKRPGGGVLSPKQGHIIGWLQAIGYDVQVHDNVKEAVKAIEDACQVAWLRDNVLGK